MRLSETARLVFLVGPPGSGKSTLGAQACAVLDLTFADLTDGAEVPAALERIVADVIALPWAPAKDASWLRQCRHSGSAVGLWAHPLEMQVRSGRKEPLFTPVRGLTTHGGFGRTGTRCHEYRHLVRNCEHVVDLIGRDELAAARELRTLIERLRSRDWMPPEQQEGMQRWGRYWRKDYNADPAACELLVNAMARFTRHLKSQGKSPRTMAGIYSDLNVGGSLIMGEDAPKGRQALYCTPCEYTFVRKVTDSPTQVARFRATWAAFEKFLREAGEVSAED